jgi:hypothetical protein
VATAQCAGRERRTLRQTAHDSYGRCGRLACDSGQFRTELTQSNQINAMLEIQL